MGLLQDTAPGAVLHLCQAVRICRY